MIEDPRDIPEIEAGPGEPPPVPPPRLTLPPLSVVDMPPRAAIPRTVGDLMTRKVVTLEEHEPIGDLEGLMRRFGFRHVPVLAKDTTLVGLISRTDLLHGLLGRDKDGKPRPPCTPETPAGLVMNRDVVTADFATPLADALRVMLEEKVGCLPVVRHDATLVGIVTETDFARLQLKDLERAT